MFSLFGSHSSKNKSRSPEVRRRQQTKARKLFVEGLEARRVMAARLDINGAGNIWNATVADQAGDNTTMTASYTGGGVQWQFLSVDAFDYYVNGVFQANTNTANANLVLNSVTFNLGDGNDTVQVTAAAGGGALPGATAVAVNLGATTETNSLTVNQNAGTTFNVNADGGGTFGPNGTFAGVTSLIGAGGADTFNINAAGNIKGSVLGRAGSDTINIAGSLTGLADMETNNDRYTIINGGSAANIQDTGFVFDRDVLENQTTNAAFNITGTNQGTSTNVTLFVNIANLQGGSTSNTFTFGAAGVLQGGIDGAAGTDTIDIRLKGPTNVNPTGPTSGNIPGVLNTTGLTLFTDGYINIESVIAAGTMTAVIDGGGNLVVTDTSGQNNRFRVRINGGNIEVSDEFQGFAAAPAPPWTLSADGKTISIGAAAFVGGIRFVGAGGDDLLTVDYSGGAVANVVGYDGGSGGNDSLAFNGGGASNVTSNYASTQTYAGDFDGNIQVGGVTKINYVGLTPVAMTNIAGVLTFNLPNLNNTNVHIGFSAGNITLTGDTFENTSVAAAGITQVILNGGTSTDQITVDATYTAAQPPLDINGGADADNILVSAAAQVRNIDGGNGNNVVTVFGTVTGTIVTGNGADTIIVQVGGVVQGLIDSGDENDILVLRGTEQDVRLGNGNDTLRVEAGSARDIQTGDAANNDAGNLPVPFNRVEVWAGATVRNITGASVNSAILINDSIQIDGTVTGNMSTLGGADDIAITATGIVNGNISMGAENDRILVAGRIDGGINGDAGNDRLTVVGGATFRVGATGILQNAGNYTNPVDAVTNFATIEALIGTTAAIDLFIFSDQATLSGFIDGQGGVGDPQDTLEMSAYTTSLTVNIKGVNIADVIGVLNTDPATVAQFTASDPTLGPNGANSIENIFGGSAADTFNIADNSRLSGTIGIDGNGPTFAPPAIGDRINANLSVAANFNVTGVDSGALTSPATSATNFQEIETLSGTAFADSFNVSAGARMANLIGNDGNDTFANSGTVGQILAGDGNDSINIGETGIVTVLVDGGGNLAGIPADRMTVQRAAGARFAINGQNSGTVGTSAATPTNIVFAFQNVENLDGGTGNDSFVVANGGRLGGGVNGQGGTDTLEVREITGAAFDVVGANTGDVFTATGSPPFDIGSSGTRILNNGTPANNTRGYLSVENLLGGVGNDEFHFRAGDSQSGWIDGAGGFDEVDVDDVVPTLVAITGLGAIDGYNGRWDNVGGLPTSGIITSGLVDEFRNINSVYTTEDPGDQLLNETGFVGRFRVSDDDPNGNNVKTAGQFRFDGSGELLHFGEFETLIGGTNNDFFAVVHLEAGRDLTLDGGADGDDSFYFGTAYDPLDNVEDFFNTGTGSLDEILTSPTIIAGIGFDKVLADDSGLFEDYWYDVNDQSIVNSAFLYDVCTNTTNNFPARPFVGLFYNQAGYDVEDVSLSGTQGGNNFFVTPSKNVPDSAEFVTFDIEGNDPTPGNPTFDYLAINFAGLTGKQLTNYVFDPATGGSGVWTFTNGGDVVFREIEKINFFQIIAVASEKGVNANGEVRIFDADTGELVSPGGINAFPGFKGGVRVATGDLNGDGIPELVAAPGVGTLPIVKVFDILSGALITEFNGLGSTQTGRGLSVAIGDINGDGAGDIITGATKGGSTVNVFYGTPGDYPDGSLGASFLNVFPPAFKGGVWVAAGNVVNNATDPVGGKRDEILVASGNGLVPGTAGGSRILILGAVNAANAIGTVGAFTALQGYRSGAFVTTAYLAPCATTLPAALVDNRVSIIVSMQQGNSANPLTSRAGNASLANQPGGVVEVYVQPDNPLNLGIYWATPTFRFQPFPGPGTGQAAHAGTRVQARFIEGNPEAPPRQAGVDRRIEFFTAQGQDGRPTGGAAITRWYGKVNALHKLVNVTAVNDAVFATLAINLEATRQKPGGLFAGYHLG
jgi:hypothetical protein